jgi:hypothetical protein
MNSWQQAAQFLLDELGDRVADHGYPTWVQIVGTPGDGAEFTFLGLDGLDVMGWLAPPDCDALGIVGTATVTRFDGPIEPPVPIPVGRTPGARFACVVGRDAHVGWTMRLPDGTEMTEVPEDGRMLDCLRRCLDLPTPPPPESPGYIQSVLWLAAILEEGSQANRRLGWRETLRLHPVASGILESPDVEVTEHNLAELVRLASSIWTWERLRRDTVVNHWASHVVSDDLAGWMDEGMFARWILAELPAADELMNQVRQYVAPSTARRIAHAVRAAA